MKSFSVACLIVSLAWTLAVVVSAASSHNKAVSAPSPSVDCSSLALSLSDCFSYISPGSTEKKPSGKCCSELKSALKTNTDCLCETLKNAGSFGVPLNMTRVMSITADCHLSSPKCHSGMAPGSGPAPASPGHDEATAPPPNLGTGSALTFSVVILSLSFAAASCFVF